MNTIEVTEGDRVHYVLPDVNRCRSIGAHRAADVVKVWRAGESSYPPGTVNLSVHTDYSNDFHPGHPGHDGHFWQTSVLFDPNGAPGTWHWIEGDYGEER